MIGRSRASLSLASALALTSLAVGRGAEAQPVPLDPWQGARPAVRVWSDRDGLPQNTVHALAFDAQGRLWVGTQDGLVMDDGRRWRDVPLPDGARFIQSLTTGRDGTMYVGTLSAGLLRIPPGGAPVRIGREEGLPDDEVRAVLETPTDLWIATGRGIARRDGDGYRVYGKPEGLPSGSVYNLAATRDASGIETVWAATGKGLARLRGERWELAPLPGMTEPVIVVATVPTRGPAGRDALWVGTLQGLCQYQDGACVERYDARSGLPEDHVNQVAESTLPDGTTAVWVGTDRGGVVRLTRGAAPLRLDVASGLPGDTIDALAATPSKGATRTFWIGTNSHGLARVELGTWRAIDAASGLPNTTVFSILESRGAAGSTYWLGTQGGVARLGPKGWSDAGLTHNPVLALMESRRDHALWLGTDGGVARVKDGVTTWWTARDGLAGTGVSALVESAAPGRQVVWVGEQDGLARIEDGKVTRAWRQADGLPSDFVVALAETPGPTGSGLLWIATVEGLVSLDEATGAFTRHPFGDDPAEHFVMSLLVETLGGVTTLWAGTRGGPWSTRLEGGLPTTWSPLPAEVKARLPNLVTNRLERDGAGRLYVFTNRGVARLDDPDGEHVTVFGVDDGLPSGECNTGASLVDSRGRVWAGTASGAALFDPSEEVIDRSPKPLVLEQGGQVGGRRLDWDAANVVFEYSLASYFREPETRYRTQLVGWDPAPSPWAPEARREYSNLPDGRYRFEVWGRDWAGNVTGPVVTPFEVRPAPWRTGWAYAGYVALAAGLGLSIAELRARSLRAKNAALEASVAARTRELHAKNDELARNVSALRRLNEDLVASQVQADRIFSALAEALPGTVLDGKYLLGEKIGAGGFGAVLRATHLALRRPIAVKVFRPTPGNDSAEGVERFRREGRTASLLTHPNAVRVYDAGVSEEGIAYLVMELLEGRTLADELAESGPLSVERTGRVLEAVCDVLAEAHRIGVVHRDIKPSNIFLHRQEGEEIVKVVDFGIAKLLGQESGDALDKLTMTGGLIGTPLYMAPERLTNKAYDARSDVYSVGVVAYQMLTGRTPFHTSGQNLLSLIWAHLHEGPKPLRDLRPDLSPEIEAVVRSALAADPAERPAMQDLPDLFAAAAGWSRPPRAPRPPGPAAHAATPSQSGPQARLDLQTTVEAHRAREAEAGPSGVVGAPPDSERGSTRRG